MLRGLDNLEGSVRAEPIFRHLEASVEAIKFQGGSSFPAELKVVVEELFSITHEMGEKYGEVIDSAIAYKKHSAIRKYAEKVISPKLQKIVEKHTGLTILDVFYILPGASGGALGFFACRLNSHKRLVDELLDSASAQSSVAIKRSDKSLKTILDLSDSLNRSTGKILKDSKSLKYNLFLPIGAFCLKDSIKDGDKWQLTSDEIVAIILHEIGHGMAWTETAADICYLGYYGNNLLREINTFVKDDPEKVRKEAIELASKAENMTTNKSIKLFLKNAKSLLSKANDNEADDTEASRERRRIDKRDRYSYTNNTSNILMGILVKLIFLSYYVLLFPVMYVELSIFSLFFGYLGEGKASRELITSNQNKLHERMADEYVSRYNMSKFINSGLIKIAAQFEYLNKTYGMAAFSKTLRESNLILLPVVLITTPWRFLGFVTQCLLDNGGGKYEDNLQRLKRNVNNLIDVLKDSKLEATIRNGIVDDIKEMEALIIISNPPHYRALEILIRGIIRLPPNLLKLPLGQILGSGGLGRDYEKLTHEVDELLSNRVFLHAAKMQRLLERG